jgi:hypothetical protein
VPGITFSDTSLKFNKCFQLTFKEEETLKKEILLLNFLMAVFLIPVFRKGAPLRRC